MDIQKKLLKYCFIVIASMSALFLLIFLTDFMIKFQVVRTAGEKNVAKISEATTNWLEKANYETITALGHDLAMHVELEVSQTKQMLTSAGKILPTLLAQSEDEKDVKPWLNSLVPLTDSYLNTFIILGNSKSYFSGDPVDMNALDYDWKQTDWWLKPFETRNVFMSDLYDSAVNKHQQITTIAYPIFGSDGSELGIVGVDMARENLTKEFFTINSEFLVDVLIYYEGGDIVYQMKDDGEQKQVFEQNHQNFEHVYTSNDQSWQVEEFNQNYYVDIRPENAKWNIVLIIHYGNISENTSEVQGTIDNTLHQTSSSFILVSVFAFVIILIVILLSIFILLRISRRQASKISAPVEEMEKQSEQVKIELQVARRIQLSQLPKHNPHFKQSITLSADMIPAYEVGGDFYDYFFVDKTHLAVVIADVSGKGVGASLFMLATKNAIRHAVQESGDVLSAITLANNQLARGNDANMFATAFLCIIDTKTHALEYVNAGHNPPIILGADGKCKELAVQKNCPLGVFKDFNFSKEFLQLSADEKVLLYTDGVTEAPNTLKERYGVNRLLELCSTYSKHKGVKADNLVPAITQSVNEFAGDEKQWDDITLVLFGPKNENESNEAKCKVIKIDNDASFSSVFSKISDDLEANGIEDAKISKARLVFEEIFVNVQKYAKASDFQVEWGLFGTQLEMIFKDNGIKFNALEVESVDLEQNAKEQNIGGLGIFMARSYAKLEYAHKKGYNILKARMEVKG